MYTRLLKVAKFYHKKFILILLGIIAGLIFTEVLLRFTFFLANKSLFGLHPFRTTITWKEDPILGNFLLTPNSKGFFVTPSKEYYNLIESNSEGFYDGEHKINKDEGIYRIILLGDSFVASLQTNKDQTIAKRLEQSLNQKYPDKKFEVIPIGLGDTGQAVQYLALKKIGLKYSPDLVIQMFLTANDLKNNSPVLQKDIYRPYFELDQDGNLKEIPFQLKSKESYYNIKQFFKEFRIVELLLAFRQNYQEKKAAASDYPIDYHVYDLNFNQDYDNSWLVTQKLILQTKEISKQQDTKYLLVALANNEQVDTNLWKALKKKYPKLNNNTDLEKPDKLLNEFCAKQKIDCLFMLNTFREFNDKNPAISTHYKTDGHWNQVGTDLAAEFLAKNLQNYFKKP